jgi:hypothetical protein
MWSTWSLLAEAEAQAEAAVQVACVQDLLA